MLVKRPATLLQLPHFQMRFKNLTLLPVTSLSSFWAKILSDLLPLGHQKLPFQTEKLENRGLFGLATGMRTKNATLLKHATTATGSQPKIVRLCHRPLNFSALHAKVAT